MIVIGISMIVIYAHNPAFADTKKIIHQRQHRPPVTSDNSQPTNDNSQPPSDNSQTTTQTPDTTTTTKAPDTTTVPPSIVQVVPDCISPKVIKNGVCVVSKIKCNGMLENGTCPTSKPTMPPNPKVCPTGYTLQSDNSCVNTDPSINGPPSNVSTCPSGKPAPESGVCSINPDGTQTCFDGAILASDKKCQTPISTCPAQSSGLGGGETVTNLNNCPKECKSGFIDVNGCPSRSGSGSSSSSSSTSKGSSLVGLLTIPSIPIEINPFTHGIAVSKTTLYLNTTDSHYHLKGLVQNTLQVTVDSISLYLIFQDRSTGTQVHTVPTIFINGPIEPTQSFGFDIDTGYTTAQAGELQHLKAMLT